MNLYKLLIFLIIVKKYGKQANRVSSEVECIAKLGN